MTHVSAPNNFTYTLRARAGRLKDLPILMQCLIAIVALINLAIVVFIAVKISLLFSLAIVAVDLCLAAAMFWVERNSLVVVTIVLSIILTLGLAAWVFQTDVPSQPINDTPIELVSPEPGTLPRAVAE